MRVQRQAISSTQAGSTYAISLLDSANGSLVASTPIAGAFKDDAMMPGCNAGVDEAAGLFYKTTVLERTFEPSTDCGGCDTGSVCCRDPTDPGSAAYCLGADACKDIPAGDGQGAQLLTIDGTSGRVLKNVTLSRGIHPAFGAFNAKDGQLYGVVPYSYTEYGLFSLSPDTGAVTQLYTWPKGQMDGIGVCEGLFLSDATTLVFQLGSDTDHLLAVDTNTGLIQHETPGFYGPFARAPLHPGKLIALQNLHNRGFQLLLLDPLGADDPTVLGALNATSLGRDLRAQDQACLAVHPEGSTIAVQASYNLASGYLARGVFVFALEGTTATLISEAEAFDDSDGKPWNGLYTWF